jgi:PAS domain S-box-containing protein
MPRPVRPTFVRYGFVPLAVTAALLLSVALGPWLRPGLPLLSLWPAVLCCAWYGGLGPGLLATFLSALGGRYFVLEPHYSLAPATPADEMGIVLYLSLGVFLSFLIEGFHRSRRQVEWHALELYNQREWFHVTLASIGDAVLATDAEGRITFMNETAEQLTGWSAERARGLPHDKVLRFVTEETREPVYNLVQTVLETGHVVGLANHTILISQGGAELPIDDSAAPIRGKEGNIQGVVLVFRDVAERRRLEHELRRQAQELIETDHRKNDFLAMLAHELRGPLGPIHNAVPLLKQLGAGQSQIVQTAEIIERQSHHARRLVEDLLDISRISRGQVGLAKQPLELAQVIGQALEISRPLVDARKQTLTVDIPEAPIRVEADPVRLTQVVVNVLNNAAKYTDEGGSIMLSVEKRGHQALLRVRDTGIGIAPDVLPHVFDLFMQSRRALGHSQGGLGIGLHLVRSLVAMHGGSVQARSDGPGQGSEFIVTLPTID